LAKTAKDREVLLPGADLREVFALGHFERRTF
jgi:hypothetical protein